MRHLLIGLLLGLAACPTSFPMKPEAICDETALVVALRSADCLGLDEDETADVRDRFTKQVDCTPPAGDSLTAEPFECLDAIADMTCDQVEAKGEDWSEWLEVSFVCYTYLSTGGGPPTNTGGTLLPGDTGDTGQP